jgi:hypothetical protein
VWGWRVGPSIGGLDRRDQVLPRSWLHVQDNRIGGNHFVRLGVDRAKYQTSQTV